MDTPAMKTKNCCWTAAILGALLLSMLCVSLHVPLHADDFTYALIGTDVHKHVEHYMQWSGRLVANMVSTGILSIPNHKAMNALNSCALVAAIFLIVLLASQLTKVRIPKISYIYIYILYWLACPALGETTFWIVGSANYLWTNLFILIFLNFFCYTYNKGYLCKIAGGILGIIAGCTNENTSVILVPLVCALIIFFKIKYRYPVKNGIVSLIGVIAGAMLLLLAPGNYNKQAVIKGMMYWDWFSKSIPEKICYHLTERMPPGLQALWPIWGSFVFMLVIAGIKKIKIEDFGFLCILFSSAALVSMSVMAAAVAVPLRSYNGPLFFALVATACLFLQTYNGSSPVLKRHFFVFVAILSAFFARSYLHVHAAYKSTDIQSTLQLQTIRHHQSASGRAITIPGFFFPRLVKESHKFHYQDIGPMDRYLHMDTTISFNQDVDFDYSVIVTGQNKPIQNAAFFSRALLAAATVAGPGVVVLEAEQAPPPDMLKHVNIILSNGKKFLYLTIEDARPIELSGKYYIGLQTEALTRAALTYDLYVNTGTPAPVRTKMKIVRKTCDGSLDSVSPGDDGAFSASGWVVHSKHDKLPAREVFVARTGEIPFTESHAVYRLIREDLGNLSGLFVLSGYFASLKRGGEYNIGYVMDDKLCLCENFRFSSP